METWVVHQTANDHILVYESGPEASNLVPRLDWQIKRIPFDTVDEAYEWIAET